MLSTGVVAHGPDKEEVVTPVMRESMPANVGHDVTMATVHYLPGQASVPHEHAGAIFAYVLDGEVVSQLQGQPSKTYKKGESWYEPPLSHHIVSKNASAKNPATLLVFAVGDAKQPIKQPIGTAKGARP
jgi:quercetin dioxygenase-like cupin family protein